MKDRKDERLEFLRKIFAPKEKDLDELLLSRVIIFSILFAAIVLIAILKNWNII